MKKPPTEAHAGPSSPARRRFTLFDLMILAAAAAVGLGLRQHMVSSTEVSWSELWTADSLQNWSAADRDYFLFGLIEKLYFSGVMVLASLTFALIPIRLMKPRGTLVRIGRQPGWVASVAAAFVLIVMSGYRELVALVLRGSDSVEVADLSDLCLMGFSLAGIAVAAAWLCSWISRRRRAERGWVDRLGRLVGWCWIVFALLFAALRLGFARVNSYAQAGSVLSASGPPSLMTIPVPIMPAPPTPPPPTRPAPAAEGTGR